MTTGRSRRPGLRRVFLLSAVAVLAGAGTGRREVAAEGPQWKEVPTVETVEQRLFTKLNEAREANLLHPVGLSPELVRLARTHSTEMARQGILTHRSETGASPRERLEAARVLFVASGENVGRSETFVAEFIHESFMNSPEHRANMLRPEFDEVGIGVVQSAEKGYFITVDFITALKPRGNDEVRDFLLGRLNEARKREAAPGLVLIPAANEVATAYARARGAGKTVATNNKALGPATVSFVSGADLEKIAATLVDRAATAATAGGIGSWFGTTPEFPGGAYYVCVILIGNNT